jgi:2-iminobutanoate/2-iminopropanoate deaminase
MSQQVIHSHNAPAAIGPYSQAIKVGNWLYTSGQIALNPKTGELNGDIREQTLASIGNLRAVVEAAGGDFTDVVKVNIYLKDMNDFPIVNDLYGQAFGDHKPARACVEVARLPKDALIELDCVAFIQ